MASFATSSLSESMNEGQLVLVRVKYASRQVVSGFNYKMQLELRGASGSIVCDVVVYDQSWTNIRQMSSSNCVPGEDDQPTEDEITQQQHIMEVREQTLRREEQERHQREERERQQQREERERQQREEYERQLREREEQERRQREEYERQLEEREELERQQREEYERQQREEHERQLIEQQQRRAQRQQEQRAIEEERHHQSQHWTVGSEGSRRPLPVPNRPHQVVEEETSHNQVCEL